MNWLITGGCGFIGRNLIKILREFNDSHSIRIIDNLIVGSLEDLKYCTHSYSIQSAKDLNWIKGGVSFVEGDILDSTLANHVAVGADIIVHLAANTGVGPSVLNPRLDCTTNVLGTLNYLEAARSNSVNKFIFASSGAPIGECVPPIHEEMPCHPVSPYGASKLSGEAYCSAYYNSYDINTIALRFGNVYGPGSKKKASVVAKFIKRALNGETLEIYGDGKQTRDFIYIKDLVRAIILSAESRNMGGEVFQIATNRETTISELTNTLVEVLKDRGVEDFSVVYGPKRRGDVIRNFSDTTKAKLKLTWQPEYSLHKGLLETVEFFTSEN